MTCLEVARNGRLCAGAEEYERKLEQCRETNQRLNRRCQTYEAGLAEKLKKAQAKSRSLGRMLANAAAESYGVKLEAIEKRCREADCNPLSLEILQIIERPWTEDIESRQEQP